MRSDGEEAAAQDAPVLLGPRFEDALVYATRLHASQRRKGTAVPYVAHLLAVASLVLEDGGGEDEAIAALLHDAVEDQDVTIATVGERFGPRVAAIVAECTAPAGDGPASWRERKQATLDQVGRSSPEAARVEAADKLHNARAILVDHHRVDDDLWNRFNAPGGRDDVLRYYRSLVDRLRGRASEALVGELRRTVMAVHRRAGVPWDGFDLPAGDGA